jgi:hypothetical protein
MKRVKLASRKQPTKRGRQYEMVGQPHSPLHIDDEMRRHVTMLAAHGLTEEAICQFFINPQTDRPINVETLRINFRVELRTGKLKADLEVSRALYNNAVGKATVIQVEKLKGGKVKKTLLEEGRPADNTAIIWYEKTRRGFREGMVFNHAGKDAEAELPTQTVVILPANGRESPGFVYGGTAGGGMRDATPAPEEEAVERVKMPGRGNGQAN